MIYSDKTYTCKELRESNGEILIEYNSNAEFN